MNEFGIKNVSCVGYKFPEGLMVSDPPYNIGYKYENYKDRVSLEQYFSLLSVFKRPFVVIQYPEFFINHGKTLWGDVDEVVSWVYNSNTAKQSRLICWYGCKPNFKKIGQPYKNPTDKRIAKRISEGKTARAYDWWNINQVKNVSKRHSHPCSIPNQITKNIIKSTAQDGQLIIDPFAGVGTILKVAKDLGHNILGTEIDEQYFKERII